MMWTQRYGLIYAVTHQGIPGATKIWKRQGGAHLQGLQREHDTEDTLISGFQPHKYEKTNIYCFKLLNSSLNMDNTELLICECVNVFEIREMG